MEQLDLKALRRAAGMTRRETAEAMGVSVTRIGAIERADINGLRLGTIRRFIRAVAGRPLLIAWTDRPYLIDADALERA